MLHDVVTFLLNFDDDKKYIGGEFKDIWKLVAKSFNRI